MIKDRAKAYDAALLRLLDSTAEEAEIFGVSRGQVAKRFSDLIAKWVRGAARQAAEPKLEPLMLEGEAASFLNMSVRTLQDWRLGQGGPPFVRVGRLVRYRRGDLLDWLEAHAAGAIRKRRPRRRKAQR
jgi:excisionase family DNA binding protein